MSFNIIPKATKPANFENGLKYLSKLDGRDKAMRFVQYFSRLAMYQLQQSDPKSDLAQRLKVLYKGISLHRKAFRIGKFMDEYKKLRDALLDGKMDELKKRLTVVLRSCMTIFLFLDNLIWLISLKVLKFEKDAIKLNAYRFRLTAAFINASLVTMDYLKTEDKIQKLTKDGVTGTELEKVKDKQGNNVVGLVKNACDIITYSNSAEVVSAITGSNLSDGTVGAFGAVSALAGGLAIWKKM